MASKTKIPRTLVTLSAAAILTVYAAGYQRTRPAAEKFEAQARRRPAPATPSPALAAPPAISTADSYPAPSPKAAPRTPRSARKAAPAPAASDQRAASAAPPALAAVPPATSNATTPPPAAAVSDASADSTPPAAVPEPVQYKDGVYLAWGWCRHGNIQASVTISGGKIVSTAIAVCDTRYPCEGVIDKLPAQVVALQSTQVDFVSGATDSSYAFTDAVNNALDKAAH